MSLSFFKKYTNKSEVPIYLFSFYDKVVGALQGLRMRTFPKKVLIAGPYVGEFGHELMDWQSCIKAMIPLYDKVHVITYPGRDFLYPGCTVHYHNVPLEKAGYKHGKYTPSELDLMAHAKALELGLKNYDIIGIRHTCTRYHRKYILNEKYELLNTKKANKPSCDIAFHFRKIFKNGPDKSRNYSIEMCDELAQICMKNGYSVRCIGHPAYSYCPEGVHDCRSEDLATSVKMISASRILVGELSGPIHLAQLCATPIVTWAPDQWRIDNCNRWNVFKVRTSIVANNTSSPSPNSVLEMIRLSLI